MTSGPTMRVPVQILVERLALVAAAALLAGPGHALAGAGGDALSWRGALAGLDVAVDAYRLTTREVLVLLEQAARRNEGALEPDAPLPDEWRETLDRIGRVIGTLDSPALPINLRVLNEQLANAWLQAARAATPGEWLAQVRAGARALTLIEGQVRFLQELVAPAGMFREDFVDEQAALESIADAADQLQRVILELDEAGRRGRDSGTKYPILVKLEIALRILLERVAAAHETGYEIGFTPRLTTPELMERAQLLATRVAQLDALLARLTQPPAAVYGQLAAHCHDATSDRVLLDLYWPLAPGADEHRPAAPAGPAPRAFWHLRRQPLPAEGSSLDPAAWETRALVGVNRAAVLDQTPPGRAWVYRLQARSWLGVDADPYRHLVVRCAPPSPVAPASIQAAPVLDAPWRDDWEYPDRGRLFYRWGDALRVWWPASPSAQLPAGQEGGLVRQVLWRSIDEQAWEAVAELDPTALSAIDVPPAGLLRAGARLRYALEVRDALGRSARSAPSAALEHDYRFWHELAEGGLFDYDAAALEGLLAELVRAQPERMQAHVAAWLDQAGPEAYGQALARFWRRVPDARKLAWYEQDRQLRQDGDSLCVRDGPAHLVERDRSRLVTELWLSQQDEQIALEPARWWTALTEERRGALLADWWRAQNQEYRAALLASAPAVSRAQALVPAGERGAAPWAALDIQTLSPAVIWAFHRSLDPIEQRLLDEHWARLAAGPRATFMVQWWREQPQPWRLAACFPELGALSEAERRAFLATGYERLTPRSGLVLLPYVWLEAATWAERSLLVASQESGLRRGLRGLRYGAWRSLDKRLGFHLRPLFAACAAGLLIALIWRAARRSRRAA